MKKFMLIVILSIVIIAVPLLMDTFILGNDFPSNISNSDWAGFIGSYIGGIATIVAVVITIVYTNRENRNRAASAEVEKREERRKSIKPYLETRCAYVEKEQEMKENDRLFIFQNNICTSVKTELSAMASKAMQMKNIPYVFDYKIMNAGAGNAVNMIVIINGFAERIVVLKGETVNLYMLMNSPNVQVEVELDYWDIESIGHYKQVDSFSLQGENRGYAFRKGKSEQVLEEKEAI